MPNGLPGTARKELFSLAYVTAVAARSGCEVSSVAFDYDSIDCHTFATWGISPHLAMQVKATSQENFQDETLYFDLSVKNYNDLRKPRHVPAILVVLHLPSDEADWMAHSSSELVLRNQAYWLNLAPLPDTKNTESQRIHIPISQTFGPKSLTEILTRIDRGGQP